MEEYRNQLALSLPQPQPECISRLHESCMHMQDPALFVEAHAHMVRCMTDRRAMACHMAMIAVKETMLHRLHARELQQLAVNQMAQLTMLRQMHEQQAMDITTAQDLAAADTIASLASAFVATPTTATTTTTASKQ